MIKKKRQTRMLVDAMMAHTDDQLVGFLYRSGVCDELWCKDLPECDEAIEQGLDIAEKKCRVCIMKWLRQLDRRTEPNEAGRGN